MKKAVKVLLFSASLILLLIPNVFAASPVSRPNVTKEAEIVSVRGDAWVKFAGQQDWTGALAGQVLTSGDSIKTGAFGKLDILFIEGTQIKVNDKTAFLIKQVRKPADKTGSTILKLEIGEIWSRARSVPEGLKIETPSATAAIKGTDWDILVDEKGTSYITVLKGTVELFNDFGTVSVDAGEQAMAEIGKPPMKMFLVKPKDRVQWIISYPMDFAKIIPFQSYRGEEVARLLPSVREKTRKDPSDMQSGLQLAGLLYDIKERDESLKLFDDILKSDPNNGKALTFKGLILLGRGEMDAAAPYFENALRNLQGKDKTEALLGMAGVHLYKNETGKAEKILEEVKQSDPSPLAGVALASFRAYQGAFAGAVDICNEYAARYPDDERFPVLTADFYLTLDEGQKAKEYIDRALKINPSSSLAHAILGRYYYLEGRGKESEQAYRKASEVDPGNADAVSELGKLLMERGHYEDSMKVHSKAIDLNPKAHAYWSKRGMLLNWVEDVKKAEGDYSNAVDLNPADYQSLDGLGFLKLKEGRPQEALEYFQKASLLEPKFAEPHIFASIAYYQLEDFPRALDELKLAEMLDPKDPVPHMIAYLIYQDTYRPMDSIKEATKALELLPNLKSVNPIEATQQGFTNLGSALLGIGMNEWASSFAEESFNPYSADSYFFTSLKYKGNRTLSYNQLLQGFFFNPISLSYPFRYQDIVRRPRLDFSINTSIGDEDGGFFRSHTITSSGYIRKPLEISYNFSINNFDNKGFRKNGFDRGTTFIYGLGVKPDYKNGLFVWGSYRGEKYGDPGAVTRPDSDDNSKWKGLITDFGYSHRFGHNNHMLIDLYYNNTKLTNKNKDPLGTGFNNLYNSFLQNYGPDLTKMFLDQGVYELGVDPDTGLPAYGLDSTGYLNSMGYSHLATISSMLDPDTYRSSQNREREYAFIIKHLFDLGENHKLSYGFEYFTTRTKYESVWGYAPTGSAIEFVNFDLDYMETLPEYTSSKDTVFEETLKVRKKRVYLSDRWKPAESLLIEMGLFYETIKSQQADDDMLHPRVGFALKLGKKHILRAAYQKRLAGTAERTLTPVSTAGLFFSNQLILEGSKVTDYQASLESRWTDNLFTVVNAERRDLRLPEFGIKGETKNNHANILSAALNTLVTEKISFFTVYKFTESKNEDGTNKDKALPLVPKHSFDAGVAWVSPAHIYALLYTTYNAKQFGDKENTSRLPDYWNTNFKTVWEPLKKHLMFKLEANNLFNNNFDTKTGYPAAGRSVYLTAEYRF